MKIETDERKFKFLIMIKAFDKNGHADKNFQKTWIKI